MAVTREQYVALLSPPEISPRQARSCIRLRLALLVWCVFVFTVVFPPAILLGLLIPPYMRRYRRKISSRSSTRWNEIKQFAMDGQRGLEW